MKQTHLIIAGTALTGFALGWLVKPSSAPGQATVQTAEESGKGAGRDGKSHLRDERPLILKARGNGEMTRDPATSEAERKFKDTFESAGERQRRSKLNRLSEALGLSPDQQSGIDALTAGRREGFRDLQGKGKTASEMVAEAANAERIYEQELRRLLDPEQMEAYQAFQEREKENDVEARAQRQYSDFVGQIDLSASQREQVQDAFRAASEEAMKNRPEGWGVMNDAMDVMGGTYSSVFDEMTGFLNEADVVNDPMEVQKRLVDVRRASAEDMAARLRNVLTPAQLNQYRATMETRANFIEASPTPVVPKNR